MSLFRLEVIAMGIRNLTLHKLRSFLTALGIIFGVAAVICMLSVTEGASADELRMLEMLGTRNIIVNSIKPRDAGLASRGNTNLVEYGVTREDVSTIRKTIPHIERIVPLRIVAHRARRHAAKTPANVLGTLPEYFSTVNIFVANGRPLTEADELNSTRVCVIGNAVRTKLFPHEDPIGETILVERQEVTMAFEVVGVLAEAITAGAPSRGVEERNINEEVYIPFSTAASHFGDILMRRQSGSREMSKFDFSGLYVTADDEEHVRGVAEAVERVFEHHHGSKVDYEIRVPLARLKILKQKKRNSQIQLGLIASISLLVGGIGIMNIMLASVTERTREIGIRRALGARRRDITFQFLVETVMLSTSGGLFGVALGYVGSTLMTEWAEWGDAIIRPTPVIVSFGLSVLVGVFFGMYPAIRAAKLDPIEALRRE